MSDTEERSAQIESTRVGTMARFVCGARLEDLSEPADEQLRLRVLDSLATAFGALGAGPVRKVREHVEEFRSGGPATLIGGGSSAPDLAAFHNGALVRYLDYNDSYLAPGETCHPSDNLAPVLAAAERAGASGATFLAALAVAYQVHARLSDEAPVRHEGFDHTTQGAYAVAAGVARALELDPRAAANAIAISGTCNVALRVTRTGALSNWKGLAYPNTAFVGTHAAFLAARGITGPPEVFEGNKGFSDSIAGDFEIDWEAEDLERVTRTIIKRYNAEIHSQSAIEACMELREREGVEPGAVEAVEVDTFEVGFHIIGGGEEGGKKDISTKEEADHSLPYMVAVALLDGELGPDQYAPDRIVADDVQELLRAVEVRPDDAFSAAFPDEMPARVTLRLAGGEEVDLEKRDYRGFHTRPADWDEVEEKLRRLARDEEPTLLDDVVQAVRELHRIPVSDLTALLARARGASG